MKPLLLSIFLSCLICTPGIAQAQPKIVTASQVNGTWKSNLGTFKILALGKQKLQVEFSGVYKYQMADGNPMANIGSGSGIATIENRTAKFKPDGAEDECTIVLNFISSRLQVEQKSNCGFGHNVTAAGNYQKVNGAKPKFENN